MESRVLYGNRSRFARSGPVKVQVEDDRTGMSVETFQRAFADNLHYVQAKSDSLATPYDHYMALAFTVRDRLIHRWISSVDELIFGKEKAVCYLSAEFLMGRQLMNNLVNIGCFETAREALRNYDLDIYELIEQEADPGLGNGGLGRLAACFLDSLAGLEIPAVGYGIRYEFGIFEQQILNGWQTEKPDEWLLLGNPWEIPRTERMVEVKFGGHTESYTDEDGRSRVRWVPGWRVIGTPYDTLVPGYNVNSVNTLRLWSARASKEFDFQIFNDGDYVRAVEEKVFSENITKVLYPNDNTPQGRELRLKQQYFFVSCSLQDILYFCNMESRDLSQLQEKVSVQLNDTHPAIAVAELMRLLLDRYGFSWERAWEVTTKTTSFTNHTLLPEALERWPISLFERLLPRHLEIIYEINHRFLDEVKFCYAGDVDRISRMSLIEEGAEKQVRMAHLACVGSHAVNGVAEMHTELLKSNVMRDFNEFWPEKFSAKTNGVTPRRWILISNPKLARLITDVVGAQWITDLTALKELESHLDDPAFCSAWRKIKTENKQDLADLILQTRGIEVDAHSLFDVQVKRIHEYKRQLLMLLYVVTLYNRLKEDPEYDCFPRTFIMAGKAAPGYLTAKLIIKLCNSIADVVNNDPEVRDRLKLVFLENFSVTLGERVYPAADLSEQISMAGKEASGTGNMKFAMNGALTIGTLDGANVEIREEVGEENFFLFGLTVDEVRERKCSGHWGREFYERDLELKQALDRIGSGHFSPDEPQLFHSLVNELLGGDQYLLMADYRSYCDCQDEAGRVYQEESRWTKMSILNVARMGKFSSDRTILQYAEDIWKVKPVPITIDEKKDSRV